jgi:hypothetical protein
MSSDTDAGFDADMDGVLVNVDVPHAEVVGLTLMVDIVMNCYFYI